MELCGRFCRTDVDLHEGGVCMYVSDDFHECSEDEGCEYWVGLARVGGLDRRFFALPEA